MLSMGWCDAFAGKSLLYDEAARLTVLLRNPPPESGDQAAPRGLLPALGSCESPVPNSRCIRTVSTHWPSLNPTDLSVPTR
jgi:hypothetical protein